MTVAAVDDHQVGGNGSAPSTARRNSTSQPIVTPRRRAAVMVQDGVARQSLVQQKLQSALSHAEKAASELAKLQTQRSFIAKFRRQEELQVCDRSVSRYRNEAAIVSFADPATAFSYSSSFMPGVHFYTYLAQKSASTKRSSAVLAREDSTVVPNDLMTDHEGFKPPHLKKSSASSSSLASAALQVWIPDTIIYGETGRAVWVYSDADGTIQRVNDVSEKLILEKLVSPHQAEHEIAVVCKEPITATDKRTHKARNSFLYHGNLIRLLTAGELKTFLSNVLTARKCFALQKYVKPNGSKAFVLRSVYEHGKPCYGWMINNVVPYQDASAPTSVIHCTPESIATGSMLPSGANATTATLPTGASVNAVALASRLCTAVQTDKSCTFIKLTEKGFMTVAELTVRMVKFVEHRFHLRFQTFVADFIKDANGRWYCLQVKAFQVKKAMKHHQVRLYGNVRPYSLSIKLRQLFLNYRDSHVLEENSDSDGSEDPQSTITYYHTQQLMTKHIHKTSQCKCCLASYPKAELSFKMTLKMINETLVRIRSRLPPEKQYTFLTAALAREPPDPALAYESWSVCSFCYAIYERDLQLQKVETKFSAALGIPNAQTALDGLSRIQDRTYVLDPAATASILPAQVTLCRLMLVLNAIYDIPKELYEAEKAHFQITKIGKDGNQTFKTVTSKLYIRVTALGYTECIPINAEDILQATSNAPAVPRKSSAIATAAMDEDEDDDYSGGSPPYRRPSARRPSSATSAQAPATKAPTEPAEKNYWLPLNLIRTIHFFAPRTPLQSKVKDTSGLTPFLTEDNSILVQFVRATEPPLNDPALVHRTAMSLATMRRRGALQPPPNANRMNDIVAQMKQPHHCILLGATKIRMAQFRSAYVTKIDFYACMALSGEMFNLKGNIGLERLRYVDTKLLTSQYRLRAYNGIFIPDDSYVTSDALSSEWMDCLKVSFHNQKKFKQTKKHSDDDDEDDDDEEDEDDEDDEDDPTRSRRKKKKKKKQMGASHSQGSLLGVTEEMDQELEHMIDLANSQQQSIGKEFVYSASSMQLGHRIRLRHSAEDEADGNNREEDDGGKRDSHWQLMELKQGLLSSSQSKRSPTRFEREQKLQQSMHKLALANTTMAAPGTDALSMLSSPRSVQTKRLWSLVLLLNQAYYLQSRHHAFCRWECHYSLFGQKRSAIERANQSPTTSPRSHKRLQSSASSSSLGASTQVSFSCTHKFFLLGTAQSLIAYLHANPIVPLHLRNDMYASTRAHAKGGEFYCHLDLSKLQRTNGFDATLDIHPSHAQDYDQLTPREKTAMARGSTPYMSITVHLSQVLAIDDNDKEQELLNDFMPISTTAEGLQVLRKLS